MAAAKQPSALPNVCRKTISGRKTFRAESFYGCANIGSNNSSSRSSKGIFDAVAKARTNQIAIGVAITSIALNVYGRPQNPSAAEGLVSTTPGSRQLLQTLLSTYEYNTSPKITCLPKDRRSDGRKQHLCLTLDDDIFQSGSVVASVVVVSRTHTHKVWGEAADASTVFTRQLRLVSGQHEKDGGRVKESTRVVVREH